MQEQQDAKMRIKSMFTYIEDQLAICPAASPAVTPLIATLASFELEKPLTGPSSYSKVKIIWIPDFPKFHRKLGIDLIFYHDWLLQMQNKLHANKYYMPTKILKIAYLQSRIADNALV